MSETLIQTQSNDTKNISWQELVQQEVESIRYGAVTITVHDGRVVQVEKTQKTRFDSKSSKG